MEWHWVVLTIIVVLAAARMMARSRRPRPWNDCIQYFKQKAQGALQFLVNEEGFSEPTEIVGREYYLNYTREKDGITITVVAEPPEYEGGITINLSDEGGIYSTVTLENICAVIGIHMGSGTFLEQARVLRSNFDEILDHAPLIARQRKFIDHYEASN